MIIGCITIGIGGGVVVVCQGIFAILGFYQDREEERPSCSVRGRALSYLLETSSIYRKLFKLSFIST